MKSSSKTKPVDRQRQRLEQRPDTEAMSLKTREVLEQDGEVPVMPERVQQHKHNENSMRAGGHYANFRDHPVRS